MNSTRKLVRETVKQQCIGTLKPGNFCTTYIIRCWNAKFPEKNCEIKIKPVEKF